LRKEKANMLKAKTIPCLSLILMGSMDWLTTFIGIAYFGAVESNPFLAETTRTSLPAFTVIKLSATILAALLFYKAEKTLLGAPAENTRHFRCMRIILKGAYTATTLLLLTAVLNNLTVVVNAI
jgi:hypothetical protein